MKRALALGLLLVGTATSAAGFAKEASSTQTHRIRREPLNKGGAPRRLHGVSTSPTAGALGIEPSQLISIAFNKPILALDLPTNFVVRANGLPLPGGYFVVPGDELMRPVEGARIELEGTGGLSTRTTASGNWTLFAPGTGRWALRVTAGNSSSGGRLPELRRKVFTDAERHVEVPTVFLTPTDEHSARTVTGSAEELTFPSGIRLQLGPGAFAFTSGLSTGTVTLTEVPIPYRPIPVAERIGPSQLWQMQPARTRIVGQVGLSVPNTGKVPSTYRKGSPIFLWRMS